ncbi:RNA polymerase sigma-70 factor [Sphingobacterium puteale]|uniref:RNA polymerase sigma-70 factor n=1 Tax=Sphingobacterium puteale TaxID=2420510 RepID=A0A420VUT6_9SPHI|nr:RNA polymerase sigma-70 factor [Sphingobacterium puteale]RKO70130.1 RNA polymerase sigma-70 factor [Sphingobacterium puteale]
MSIDLKCTEADLLSAIAQGDASAFKVLYDRYYQRLYRFAFQLVSSKDLAQDIVQDVMIIVWQKGPELTHVDNIENYIKSIAKRRAIDLIRRNIHFLKIEEKLSYTWIESSETLLSKISLKEAQDRLNKGIELLPKQQQLVYQLCHQQDLKYEEVAEKLGISKGTVHKHMKLALKFLRNYLKKYPDLFVVLVVMKFL